MPVNITTFAALDITTAFFFGELAFLKNTYQDDRMAGKIMHLSGFGEADDDSGEKDGE